MESILVFIKNNKLIVLLTLFGPLFFNVWLYFDYKEKLEIQRTVNTYLESEIAKSERWLEPIKHMDSIKSSLLNRMDVAQTLAKSNPERFRLFTFLSDLPDGIALQKLAVEGGQARFYGIATSKNKLESFIGVINKSSICIPGNPIPKPGNKPGSFSIDCKLNLDDYDET